jgi:hypothetical protein
VWPSCCDPSQTDVLWAHDSLTNVRALHRARGHIETVRKLALVPLRELVGMCRTPFRQQSRLQEALF